MYFSEFLVSGNVQWGRWVDGCVHAWVTGSVCVCHSPRSRAGIMIANFYPPRGNLQLIIARSMDKAVTFHTTHPIFLLKEDSNCLVISETLHHERGANSSLPSDRPKRYH